MNKSGTSAVLTTSYQTITGWTADTSGYPGSSLSGNGLSANGSKTGATLSTTCAVANSTAAGLTVTLQLMVNGVAKVAGSPTSVTGFATTNVSLSGNTNVASGDVITLQALGNSGTYLTIVASGTFVRIT